MPSLALIVITNGRWEYLRECLKSADEKLANVFLTRILVDDSGQLNDPAPYHGRGFDQVCRHHTQRGLAAAVNSAWEMIPDDVDYVFHLEEDFTFNVRPNLPEMVRVLQANPHLSQLVLKRQPWSDEEKAAGGIIEMDRSIYTDRKDDYGHCWVEHRRIFSLNPCVYPANIACDGWPASNELGFTEALNINPDNRFAFWGHSSASPVVTHIGARRAPGWSL